MKIAITVISICMVLLLGMGCSEEKQFEYPERNAKVRKPIQKPVRKKTETIIPIPEAKPEPALKKAEEFKSASVDERGQEKEKGAVKSEEKGYYITKKGDSLSKIAGERKVFGEALKWPILYRLNKENFDKIANDEKFSEKEIPEGTRLKIITPDEARENLKKREKKIWVINVLSSPKKERIEPSTVSLIRNGYPAYITTVKVKGKDWLRLRVGFFKQKRDADNEGKKIMAMLNLTDIWTTKVGDIEFGGFGGY
ncbi:SPOR domain-containing protein [Thermodesulfobacteriota bacterium]